MALPIWALYMDKVYNDPRLNFTKGDFERPLKELSVEVDCDKFGKENPEDVRNEDDFEF